MDVPQSLKPAPASALELAKREYHAATIAMGELDAKVIDAAATLDELKTAYGASIVRVNAARDKLVEARTPPQATPAAKVVALLSDEGFMDALDRDLHGQSREHALSRISESDRERLVDIAGKDSAAANRAAVLLAFLAGEPPATAQRDSSIDT